MAFPSIYLFIAIFGSVDCEVSGRPSLSWLSVSIKQVPLPPVYFVFGAYIWLGITGFLLFRAEIEHAWNFIRC